MSRSVEEALADCLERIETGEVTLEEALRLYPALRAELEPLLDLSAELRAMPKVAAPARLRGYGRPVFRSPAAGLRRDAWWHHLLPLGAPRLGWAASLARVAVALGIVSLATGGTIVASASSLPDQPLYPVKLAVENAQVALAPNEQTRANLELQFANKRVAEMQSAAEQGNTQAVAQAAALYQQQVDAAIKASQAASPSAPAAPDQVQDTLRQNVAALQQVQEKVKNATAQSAVATAIARSEAASSQARESRGRSEEAPGKAAAQPAVTIAATPTPTPGTVSAPAEAATATPTAEPGGGHEPPGKSKGRAEDSTNPGQDSTNPGQGGSSSLNSRGLGQSNGAGDNPGKEGQPRTQSAPPTSDGSGQAQSVPAEHGPHTPTAPSPVPTTSSTVTATPTVTPTVGSASAGKGGDAATGVERGPKLTPGTTAPKGQDNGRGQPNDNDKKGETRGKGSPNADILGTILESLRSLVPNR